MTQRNTLIAVLWMVGALLSFSAAALGIRELSRALNVFEMLAIRNATGIAMLLAVALLQSQTPSLQPQRLLLHLFRNGVHFGATVAWALGLTLLPLATAFALEFTMPAWVALLAIFFLHERLTLSRAASVVLGFVGVIIILRPGLTDLHVGAFVMLAAAFGFAVTTIATKKLTITETTFSILLWMNLIQLPLNWTSAAVTNHLRLGLDLGGGALAFAGKLEVSHILPLLGLCVGGLSSHYCLTNAYRYGDASVVMTIDFLRVPLIALVGWQLYNEAIDPFVFVGSAIMIAGILWNLRAEAQRG